MITISVDVAGCSTCNQRTDRPPALFACAKTCATQVTDAFLHIHQTQLLWCCDDHGRIDFCLFKRGMMKRLMTNIMMMTNCKWWFKRIKEKHTHIHISIIMMKFKWRWLQQTAQTNNTKPKSAQLGTTRPLVLRWDGYHPSPVANPQVEDLIRPTCGFQREWRLVVFTIEKIHLLHRCCF